MKRSRKLFVIYIFVGWMVFVTIMSLIPEGGVALGEKGDKIAHFCAYFMTSLLF